MESLLVEVKAKTKTKLYTISFGNLLVISDRTSIWTACGKIRGCNWATDTKEAETRKLPAPHPTTSAPLCDAFLFSQVRFFKATDTPYSHLRLCHLRSLRLHLFKFENSRRMTLSGPAWKSPACRYGRVGCYHWQPPLERHSGFKCVK